MAGLLGSTVGMTVCTSEKTGHLDLDTLRRGAFNNVMDPDGIKSGWVGLGDLLDTDNFFLASCDNRFAGFSWRMDVRKPSAAVIRLHLEERLRAEKEKGNKISSKRKKELREEITERLTAAAEFIPSLTDCVWDAEKGRLFIFTNSEKTIERICSAFLATFKIDVVPIIPEVDMAEVYGKLQLENGLTINAWELQPMGSASLRSTAADAQSSSVAVQNNSEAVSEALDKGLTIKRIAIVASKRDNVEYQIYFTLNDDLVISGLRLPKPEKGAGDEATFLINASICADCADISQEISISSDDN